MRYVIDRVDIIGDDPLAIDRMFVGEPIMFCPQHWLPDMACEACVGRMEKAGVAKVKRRYVSGFRVRRRRW